MAHDIKATRWKYDIERYERLKEMRTKFVSASGIEYVERQIAEIKSRWPQYIKD